MRYVVAVGVGLLLPMIVTFAVLDEAADRVGARLHITRVEGASPGAYLVRAAEAAWLPARMQAALHAAARDGAADLPLAADVREAWDRLQDAAGTAARVLVEVDGVLVSIEPEAAATLVEKGLAIADRVRAWG